MYHETTEAQFFKEASKIESAVLHFYKVGKHDNESARFDALLEIIAQEHLEAQFLRISISKAKFLKKNLGIKVR
jgi:hypothetical protein